MIKWETINHSWHSMWTPFNGTTYVDILTHTGAYSIPYYVCIYVYVQCISLVCVIFVQAFELARRHSEFQVHVLLYI